MKKKIISLLLACVLCIALYVPSCTFDDAAAWSLDENTVSEMKAEFSDEFTFIELRCGHSIDEINNETFLEITDVVNRNFYRPDYSFSSLMDTIGFKRIQLEAAPMRVNSDSVYRSYGPITGEFLNSAAVSSTVPFSETKSFTVSAEIIPGLTLGGDRSWPVSYSLTGLARGTTLYNGMGATHNYACGVLFATVMKRTSSSGTTYYLSNMNASDFVSCAAVTAQGTLFVDAGSPEYQAGSYWTGLSHFKQYLRSNPTLYLQGL